ncbi:MAG: hypothetical protein ACRC8A_06085 [Microcoleaceae cyanobacterium]
MTRSNVRSSDIQWVEKVRNFLIDVARASLADIPRLPERVATDALPLAQQAQQIQGQIQSQAHPDHQLTHWQEQHQDWIESVRKLLIELSRISLSEYPRLPENLAQRALILAETAQDLQEKVADWDAEAEAGLAESLDLDLTSSKALIGQLRIQLGLERDRSSNSTNPQWQSLFQALDQLEEYYRQLSQ